MADELTLSAIVKDRLYDAIDTFSAGIGATGLRVDGENRLLRQKSPAHRAILNGPSASKNG